MATVSYCLSLRTSPTDTSGVFNKTDTELIEILKSGGYGECYELIQNQGNIKPYFDLDIKAQESMAKIGQEFDVVYERRYEILDYHKEYLLKTFGEDSDLAISEASSEGTKVSFHIVITNKKTTMNDMYQISRGFKYPLDTTVYHSRQARNPRKFRTILSKKENRTLTPMNYEDDLTKHIVSNPTDDAVPFKYTTSTRNRVITSVIDTCGDGRGIGKALIQTDSRAEWFKIGVSLYAVLGEEIAHQEWLDYSSSWSGGFNQDNFDKAWRSIVEMNYLNGGWELLKKHLPEDRWKDFIPQVPPQKMNDKNLAVWFLNNYNRYKIRYTGKDYYIFKNHKWQSVIEDEIIRDLQMFICDAYEVLVTTVTTDEDKELARKQSHKAGMSSFINGVMTAVKRLCADSKFKSKLNQDRYLLGFNNGVLDLKTKEFREGLPEDFISIGCGYNYPSFYDEEKMNLLKDILFKICCEEEDRYESLLKMLGRSMCGDNSQTSQKFYCFYGNGHNGKSCVQNLLDCTFGDYCKYSATSLMTQKEQRSDGCNSDIANLVGSRFCVMSETENGQLNPQTLKKHTGDNKIQYREIHNKTIYTTLITWTPIIITNDKIRLNNDDGGVMRRFVYIPFKAKFVSDNPEDYDNIGGRKHYKAIENLNNDIYMYRDEFLHLLLEYCDYTEKLTFKGEIAQETEQLIRSQDLLLDMLSHLFQKGTQQQGVAWNDMKNILKQEYQSRFRQVSDKITDTELLDRIKVRLGDHFGSTFVGTAGGSQNQYIDSDGNVRTSRRLFYGITRAIDEGEEPCKLD